MRERSRAITIVVACLLVLVAVISLVLLRIPSPAPAYEFASTSQAVDDIRFSPDGQQLAVASSSWWREKQEHSTRIYQVPDGKVIRELDDAGAACNWSADGAVFAAAMPNDQKIRVWDALTWSRKHDLRLPELSQFESRCLVHNKTARLAFDRRGNLYAVQDYDADGIGVHVLDGVKVWRGAASGRNDAIDAVTIGTCNNHLDMSVASVQGENGVARLAISYYQPCSINGGTGFLVEIAILRSDGSGRPTVQKAYGVLAPDPRASYQWSFLQMTPDGQYLVVRTLKEFCVFRLFDDHGDLVHSRPEPLDPKAFSLAKALDISLEGRLAAYCSADYVQVVRIPSGQTVLALRQARAPFALSPDGSLLAVADRARKKVLFYRIPQDTVVEERNGVAN